MKINVCTEYADNYQEIADITLPLMKEYCKRNGYSFDEIRLEDGNQYPFKKHEYFKKTMLHKDVEAIFYLDIDAAITNMTTRVESFISVGYDFFITEDFNELNGGAVIILNTKSGRQFNDFILNQKDNFENEQNAYNHFRLELPQMKVLQHPSINSYRYSLYPECKGYVGREDLGDWVEGNFVLHVPGASLNQRIKILSELKDTIIYE